MYKFFDWLCDCIWILLFLLIGVLGTLPIVFIYNYWISVLWFVWIIIYYAIYFWTIKFLFNK